MGNKKQKITLFSQKNSCFKSTLISDTLGCPIWKVFDKQRHSNFENTRFLSSQMQKASFAPRARRLFSHVVGKSSTRAVWRPRGGNFNPRFETKFQTEGWNFPRVVFKLSRVDDFPTACEKSRLLSLGRKGYFLTAERLSGQKNIFYIRGQKTRVFGAVFGLSGTLFHHFCSGRTKKSSFLSVPYTRHEMGSFHALGWWTKVFQHRQFHRRSPCWSSKFQMKLASW